MPELPDQWIVAGLGNPGENYAKTRHNVGFEVVDSFLESFGLTWKRSLRLRGWFAKYKSGGRRVSFIKPNTFMNASGRSIRAVVRHLKADADSVICVYDDITLPVGRLKLSIGGSDGGHNGIKDIQRTIGNSFVRFRIGIGGKTQPEMDLKNHVLGRFTDEERVILKEKIEFYRNSMETVFSMGPMLAMNTINQKT